MRAARRPEAVGHATRQLPGLHASPGLEEPDAPVATSFGRVSIGSPAAENRVR